MRPNRACLDGEEDGGLARVVVHQPREADGGRDLRPFLVRGFTQGLYCRRGIARAKSGEPELAISDFAAAIEKSAGLKIGNRACEGYYRRGRVYASQGEIEQAIADFDEAIRLSRSRYGDAYLARGWAYLKQDELDKAVADFGHAIDRAWERDSKARAYAGRSRAYRRKGDDSKADADRAEAEKLRQPEKAQQRLPTEDSQGWPLR